MSLILDFDYLFPVFLLPYISALPGVSVFSRKAMAPWRICTFSPVTGAWVSWPCHLLHRALVKIRGRDEHGACAALCMGSSVTMTTHPSGSRGSWEDEACFRFTERWGRGMRSDVHADSHPGCPGASATFTAWLVSTAGDTPSLI